MEEPDTTQSSQQESTRNPDGTFKKGVSGNPGGRVKGKSLKEWAREYFELLTEEERVAFFNKLDPALVWKMAEGNPANTTDVTSGGKPIPIYVSGNDSSKEDSETPKEN